MTSLLRTAVIAAALAFAIAGIVNVVLLGIAAAVDGPIVVEIPGRSQPVGIVEVLVVTALGSLVGALGTALVARWSWGLRFVVIAGSAITLLSLFGVFAATSSAAVVALLLMHLATGATIIAVNVILHRRRARAQQSPR